MTDYNAVRHGPGRDLVAEYVDACRREGLRVGLYYCFYDWHHPDALRCERDERAHRRFLEFTHGCVRELMTNYGPIDILWYDGPFPGMGTPAELQSRKLNRMVRRLQPGILINNRSFLPEDFDVSESRIVASPPGRPWEACLCMTHNADWGYAAHAHPDDWHSVRRILEMLRQVTMDGGNLLLNIGPKPDGSPPAEAVARLLDIGKWLRKNGEAVYGARKRSPGPPPGSSSVGQWTRDGRIAYFWCDRWPGRELTIARVPRCIRRVTILASGKPAVFVQKGDRLFLTGLPARSPDRIAGVTVLKIE
jgi:alpha-L-fucosidase